MKKEQVIYAIIIVVSIISIVVPLIKELHRESLPLEISTNEMPLAKLAFSRKIVDLGEVPEDTILVAKYMLYNTSENLLEIEYVNPDCSCTDYKLSKHSIHPKDSALLTLFLMTVVLFPTKYVTFEKSAS